MTMMKVATLATRARLLAPRAARALSVSSSSSSSFGSASSPSFGIAFDIDGVLIRGGQALPQARDVLLSLRENGVPHIFLTNGGGCLEEDKAANLGRILDLEIDPAHMVLSHTPMRELTTTYADSRVLIMGSHDVYTVAKHYGFKKVVSIEDLAHQYPHAYPFRSYDKKVPPFHDEPIEAIIVMHDPIDWAPELQIAIDVLIGGNPPGKGREDGKQTPLFVSNDDFIFSGAYPYPRFAQGAFTRCLKMLYEQRTGRTLEVTRYGKPHNVTYDFAEKKLNTINHTNTPIRTIYGIGDNPHSDIHGANQAGAHWTSMLVRTGVFNDANGRPEHEPDVYADAVVDAVRHIYKIEGLDPTQL